MMDVSERNLRLESYCTAHARLLQALKTMPQKMWQYRPAPSEWSIHEVLLHLADSEAHMYIRARCFVAEPGGKVLAFDHDKWTEKLDYHRQNAGDALVLFQYLRKLTYDLLKDLPEEAWGNTVEHSQYGVMTLEQWLERADKHANDHLGQIKKNFELWSKSAS